VITAMGDKSLFEGMVNVREKITQQNSLGIGQKKPGEGKKKVRERGWAFPVRTHFLFYAMGAFIKRKTNRKHWRW